MEMFGKSVFEGFSLILRRFRLVVLIYALNLAITFLVVWPIYNLLVENVGITGFGRDLVQQFDLILWREIVLENRDVFLELLLRILWVLPLVWVWKTATQVGIIYALHQGAIWPFWSGVYFYTIRGLILGVVFLLFKAIWAVSVFVGFTYVQQSYFSSEVGVFWLIGVIFPFVLLTGFAIIELYQRYGRLALVIRNNWVMDAISMGFYWPSKNSIASLVYISWYFIGLAVSLISLVVNAKLHVGISYLLLALVIQQAIQIMRSAVTVGWVGSEVFLFEHSPSKKV